MLRVMLAAALSIVVVGPTVAADPPAKKKKEASPVLAHIRLAGALEESASPPDSPFAAATENFKTKLDRIAKAKRDESVKGLVLEFGGLGIGFGKSDELRRAIAEFKKTGKKVFCYAEDYGAKDYLVALAGDMVATPPSGGVDIHGIQAEITFYKDFFEKVKVKADFLQMGDYKGAAEPYMRSGMSPEFRKQFESLIDDFFEKSYLEVIATSRPEKKWTTEQVRKLVDKGVYTANSAVAAGLVDRLAYFDEFIEMAKGEIKGADGIKLAKNYGVKKVEDVDLSNPFAILKLLNPPKPKNTKDPKVAVIYAVGSIVTGKGVGNPLTGGDLVGSTTMCEAIREARNDESVKAIVLRVDSPGGSALASDLIWNELQKSKKPVVASMGDVAASGGYYISMGCQKVFAEPGTLTGSIGVVGGKLVTGGVFDWVGLKTESITRGANAGIMSSERLWNDSERKVIRAGMEDVYDQFLDRVLTNRKKAGMTLDREKLLTLAGGRVWTGRQAKANGLVDELGTLEDAIAAAKKLANMEGKDLDIQTMPKPKSFFDRLAEGGLELKGPTLSSELMKLFPEMLPRLRSMNTLLELKNDRVWLIQPYVIELK